VVLGHPPHQGEPQTAAARLRREERLEGLEEALFAEPGAVVLHHYLGRLAV
jgi:hypothetical protein